MRVAVFSTKGYDREFLTAANAPHGHELTFFEPRLGLLTAPLAHGHDAVCAFVNDTLDAPVLEALAAGGTRLIALRSAGFNHVDLVAADRLGLVVARVPAYSPNAVAEHTVALILALDRKLHRAHARVREGNFSLEGLLGFDLCEQTAGVVGTGQIGRVVARILLGFGCRVLCYDPTPDPAVEAMGAAYVALDDLLSQAGIVTLHCPLTPRTRHLIDARAVSLMRDGVMLINTSRGGLVDTRAVIAGLKSGKIGHLGLDVYEEEEALFFEDLSAGGIQDDVFARLLTFPNVIVTGHQAFFTREALARIAETTLANVTAVERTGTSPNRVGGDRIKRA
ncbi:MAG: 2-hydroxyacid dehydrogenase [Planctomycetes bacterium]|nr:2-hydroxyacid dehydrogenase [Planctomycetota bacterium]